MKNKKNILIVSPGKVALTETFIRAHIERLQGNISHLYGYNLNFFTTDDISLADYYKTKPTIGFKLLSLLPHFLYFKIAQRKRIKLKNTTYIKQYLLDKKIDVVLAEYGIAGSDIAPVCNEMNIPLIIHFHGYDASRKDVLARYRSGYSFMFSSAKKIVAVSNAMKAALVSQGCPAKKIVLNTYGPHPSYLEAKPDYQSNIIITIGRHTYKKAPYLAILAFQKVLSKHPNALLNMIGDGELYEVSKNMIDSLGLAKNIKLFGALEREAIIEHSKKAFLMIQHSLVAGDGDSEGTPVGIIEAMALGLPVVATKHAGIPDVVINDETGFLVEEGDIDEMADKICKLIENRTLCANMGGKGKERISQLFTLEKHINVLETIIHDS